MMFSATWPAGDPRPSPNPNPDALTLTLTLTAGRFNNVRQIADSFLVNPAML